MEHLVFQILAMRFLERCRRGLSPDGRLDLGAHRKVILDMEGKGIFKQYSKYFLKQP